LSAIRKVGAATTRRAKIKLSDDSWWTILTPFPKTARSGMTRINKINDAPKRIPINIPGFSCIIEFKPTANSGIEVRIPRTKKETAKEESLSLFVNLVNDLTMIPLAYHMRIKDMK
jgi:hypothetical protein